MRRDFAGCATGFRRLRGGAARIRPLRGRTQAEGKPANCRARHPAACVQAMLFSLLQTALAQPCGRVRRVPLVRRHGRRLAPRGTGFPPRHSWISESGITFRIRHESAPLNARSYACCRTDAAPLRENYIVSERCIPCRRRACRTISRRTRPVPRNSCRPHQLRQGGRR